MNHAQLRAEHAAAGAAFTEAEAAYYAAATRLHAVERVLNSPNIVGPAEAHPTFAEKPRPVAHPRFSTAAINRGSLAWPESDERAAELLAGYPQAEA